jgi:hypothetical protein
MRTLVLGLLQSLARAIGPPMFAPNWINLATPLPWWERPRPTGTVFSATLITRGGSTSRHAGILKNVAISTITNAISKTMLARAAFGAATMHFAKMLTLDYTNDVDATNWSPGQYPRLGIAYAYTAPRRPAHFST